MTERDFADASADVAAPLVLNEIYEFVDAFRSKSHQLHSFCASFSHPSLENFETAVAFFWNMLTALRTLDERAYAYDVRVSEDPRDPQFSFSLKGEAFFILLLHPHSPRMSRRAPVTTIVFNPHQQFEDLRTKGLFTKIRDLIRKRDAQLQGFSNPMMMDHGTARSEVFQYTGQAFATESKCPFQRAKRKLLG